MSGLLYIDISRANEIIDEEGMGIDAIGPAQSLAINDGMLSNDWASEIADLTSEEAFRAQVVEWRNACGYADPRAPASDEDASTGAAAEYDSGAPCEEGDWVLLGEGTETMIGEVIAVLSSDQLEIRWGNNGKSSTSSPRLLWCGASRESAEAELTARGGDIDAQ